MNKPKILVVEDESIVAIDLSHTLMSLGYDVIDTAGTGEQALSLIYKKRPDLVLMDIQLRGNMDGIQVAERIQNTLKIPVIYLTAFSDSQTLSRARQTEPYGYIQKSFDHNDLHSTIEMALYKSKMERSLIEKERLLSVTFRSIREGVITADAFGVIRLINKSAEDLLHVKYEQNAGKCISDLNLVFYDYESRHKVFPFGKDNDTENGNADRRLFELLKGSNDVERIQLHRARFFVETAFTFFPLELTSSFLAGENESNDGIVFVFRNIEEEHNYQEMQSRLVSIINSSEDAIIGSMPDGTIHSWNSGAERLFGYSAEEVKNRNLSILTPDYFPNEIPDKLDRLKNKENIEHYEAVRRSKNGNLLDMSIGISAIRDTNGKLAGVSIIARDITARKAMEKELLEIQDRERTRIGQDLHDSLGQHLTGILLKTKALENDIIKTGEKDAADSVREIMRLVKDSINETRELAKGLIPVTLQTEGLASAIRELCCYSESIHGFPAYYNYSGEVDCENPGICLQLYHIAQEAINNAARHAHSHSIQVSLHQESAEIVLSVIDDGVGMPDTKTAGLGLRIMQYRANMISAHLSVQSVSGEGTTIICRVPYKQRQGAK